MSLPGAAPATAAAAADGRRRGVPGLRRLAAGARRGVERLGVGGQLTAAFLVVLALVTVQGAVSLVTLAGTDRRAAELSQKWLAGVGHLAQARAAIVDMREMEVKHSRTDDRSYHAEYEQKIAEDIQLAVAEISAQRALADGAAEAQLLAALDKSWADYQRFCQKVLALGRDKHQADAADISDGASAMALDETLGALGAYSKFAFDGGRLAAEQAHRSYVQARVVVLALLGGAIGLGALMAWRITRGLVGQLGGEPRAAVQLARAVAAGDLRTRVDLKPGDRHSLMAALHDMQGGLTQAVRQVRLGSEHVASGSSQIAAGSQDLSGRTERQASALQQTAATMEELGTIVRSTADHARQADVLAQGAATVATEGGAKVGQVVQTMKGINDSSRRIADIISVIDSIAFQTNILALNAAVEAARAGEQGRGFAVVASEVRSLAGRSAEAAREIKTLILASVERVEQGTTQVDQAGRTMHEIVEAIARVSAIVGAISAGAQQQHSGVTQVSDAVGQMDQTTQQNAALVEQSAAAAENLNRQAQELVKAVAVFRLD